METSFAQALDALYVLLDQPAPLREEIADGRHEISVDTRAGQVGLRLGVSPNGRSVLIETVDGPRFAADAAMRERQIAAVLHTALGLAASNGTSAGAEAVPDEPDALRLRLQARVSLAAPRSQVGVALKSAIEDMIEQMEWQGAHLDGSGLAGTASGLRGQPAPAADAFIFRP
ncbi:hypothetical protein [Aquibium microcysteis]|uniref:hypothetical protein n=1 Tax=Aquibium microcysteis TaxID=675281 RepID=UPI00165D0553|nr:hypothetical protein [Aquibium microcysteis]